MEDPSGRASKRMLMVIVTGLVTCVAVWSLCGVDYSEVACTLTLTLMALWGFYVAFRELSVPPPERFSGDSARQVAVGETPHFSR